MHFLDICQSKVQLCPFTLCVSYYRLFLSEKTGLKNELNSFDFLKIIPQYQINDPGNDSMILFKLHGHPSQQGTLMICITIEVQAFQKTMQEKQKENSFTFFR